MADLIPAGSSLNAGRTAINQKIADIDKRVNRIVSNAGDSNDEIFDARYDSIEGIEYDVLKERLDAMSFGKASKLELEQYQSFIDSQLAALGDGTPKEVFATLSALQAAYPTGAGGVRLVTADGKLYGWIGSTWTAIVQYQSTGLADGSVSPVKTSFSIGTANLFNKDSLSNIMGQTLDMATGAQSTDATRFITHWVDITAYVGKKVATYYFSGATLQGTATFFYDSNKTFISAVNGQSVVPSNAAYIRSRPLISALDTVMIWVNQTVTNPTAYVPYAYIDAAKVFASGKTLIENLNEVNTKLAAPVPIDKTDFYVGTLNLFNKNDANNILGQTLDPSTGAQSADATRFITHWVDVTAYVGQKIACYFLSSGVYTATFTFFYDANKNFISSANGQNVIPANAKYVRSRPPLTALNDVMFWVGQSASLPTSYTPFALLDGSKVVVNGRKLNDALASGNLFEGKKWTSYGDSITEMNTWQPYVISALGLVHTNRGVGGTTVAGDSVTVNSQIRYSMNKDERISTIPLDTEIITVMGGSNDWGQSIPIGSISDTTNTTFYGAYKIMLDKIRARVPNVRIIIMIPPFRDQEATSPIIGQYMENFRDAARKVAYLYGYQTIDLRANAGINQANVTTFLQDVVHPNDAGGKRIAEVVIGAMKSIQPI